MASQREIAAMRQALDAARAATGRISPNPRVGCVLLDPADNVIAVGEHHGPGRPKLVKYSSGLISRTP